MGANLRQDESRSDWAVDRPASVRLAVIDAPLGRLAPAKSHPSPSARFRNTVAMPPIWRRTTEFNHEATILFVDRPIAEPDRGRARRRSRFKPVVMRGSEAPAHRGVGHGGRMRQRAEAVKAAAHFSSRHPAGVALTAEHAAARSPRDRPVIIPQPVLTSSRTRLIAGKRVLAWLLSLCLVASISTTTSLACLAARRRCHRGSLFDDERKGKAAALAADRVVEGRGNRIFASWQTGEGIGQMDHEFAVLDVACDHQLLEILF